MACALYSLSYAGLTLKHNRIYIAFNCPLRRIIPLLRFQLRPYSIVLTAFSDINVKTTLGLPPIFGHRNDKGFEPRMRTVKVVQLWGYHPNSVTSTRLEPKWGCSISRVFSLLQ